VSELEALLLGIVQGLTEFLPVSSSGHLVIAQELLGIHDEGGLLFEVSVHVATLAAILVFYRSRIGRLIAGALGGNAEAWRYIGKLALGTVPALFVGLFARDTIESFFAMPSVVGWGLLVTGAFLWTTRWTLPVAKAEEPGWTAALWIGCAQAVAIIPGISRSGATVAAALALGVAPAAAAEFSFLLGVVAISGAAVLMIPELSAVSPDQWSGLLTGAGAAMVSGLLALWLFVWLLKQRAFYAFAYYDWAVGALVLFALAQA
jgi:undecaprenyl-diphosphatase